MSLKLSIIMSLVGWCSLISAQEVEITVHGTAMRGTLVRSDDDHLVLRRSVVGKNGVESLAITYPRSEIDSMTAIPSSADAYALRASTALMTFTDQYAMAVWCRDNGLAPEAVRHAITADQLDPDNPLSSHLLRELGYGKFDGTWVVERHYLAAHGLISYDGLIWTPDEAQKRASYDAALREQSAATQHVRDLAWAIPQMADRITAGEKHLAALEARDKQLNEQVTADQALLARLAKAPPKPKRTRRNRYGSGGESQAKKAEKADEASQAHEDLNRLDQEIAQNALEVESTRKRIMEMTADKNTSSAALPVATMRKATADAAILALRASLPAKIVVVIPGIG